MDEETKALLKENTALAKENNMMLKRLIRAQKFSTIYRIFYWTVIILSSLGAYYFIQPYFNTLLNLYTNSTSNQQVQQIINSFKKK
jgi:hypothetical protein